MEDRVTKIEDFAVETRDRLTKIETSLDQTVTKADLTGAVGALQVEMHKGFADMIKWVVGTAVVMGAMGITIMTFVLNNAAPKSSTSPPAPIIIYTQPAPQPTAAKP